MVKIAITGGTGLVGKALSRLFVNKGYQVVVLSRTKPKNPLSGVQYSLWDPYKGFLEADVLREVDHLIHLAGANVAEKRWTHARKKLLLESRTKTSEQLVDVLRTHANRVKTVISMSAIGWYGPDHGKIFTEDDPAFHDFLGTTCQKWEESIKPVEALGKRLVILRSGIVLTPEGGALAEFMKPLKLGVAPILGSGKQIISWIQINDLCRMFDWILEKENISGVYNAVSPNPVSNKELMLELAKQLRGKFYLPIRVPSFILKIILGEMSIEVLKSATVSSSKIERAGFQFHFPELRNAISDLL